MNEYYFSLCGIHIQLSSVMPLIFVEPVEEFAFDTPEAFAESFQISQKTEVDITGHSIAGDAKAECCKSVPCIEHYTIHTYSGILPQTGRKVYDCFRFQIYADGDWQIYEYRVGNTINPYHARLVLDPAVHDGVREHTLLLPEEYAPLITQQMMFSSMLGFEPMSMWHGRIPMHAASVKLHDKVILFTGPSGMGKSTQSNLWIHYLNAQPVNGDKTILLPGEQDVRAYGSFYAGSSEIIHNISGSVGAIISLKQGPENIIHRLGISEAFRKIYPRFLVPQWDSAVTGYAMELIQRIVMTVPVYELECRPDEAAVQLAYKTIFETTE